MLLFTWIIDVVFRSMKCVCESGAGGGGGRVLSGNDSLQQALLFIPSNTQKRRPWTEEKKDRKKWLKMPYRFLRILKVQPKKTLKTYYFPLLPTSSIPFFMILGFIFQDYLQMVCSVLSQSLPSTFLFLPGERYHRDQCQRPLLQTLTQKAHSRPLEASICFTNVRLGDITRC